MRGSRNRCPDGAQRNPGYARSERLWNALGGGIGAGLPLPLAGEGWGGGASTSGLSRIAEDVPEWREPSPAALYEHVGLSRKRERRSKPTDSEIHVRLLWSYEKAP